MKKLNAYLIMSLFSVILLSAAPTMGLTFTGSNNSYIDLGSIATAPSQFTIEAWVNYQSFPTNEGAYILSTEDQPAGGTGPQGFSLRTSNNKIQLCIGNGNWTSVTGSTALVAGTWYHLAATCSSTEISVYVNGVLDGTATLSTPMVTSVKSIRFGDSPTWNGRMFNGTLADLRFWSVVRTASDIFDNMSSTLTGSEIGLLADWKMNEGNGTVVADLKSTYNITKPANILWYHPAITIAAPTAGLVFSGANTSFIDLGTTATNPSKFTIEAMVNCKSFPSNDCAYIMSTEDGTAGGSGYTLRLNVNKILLTIGNGNWTNVNGATVLKANTWYHIAATCTDTEIKVYVNGVLDGTTTLSVPMILTTKNIRIADGPSWTGRMFNGMLSDLRFWNVVRSESEISSNITTVLTGSEPGLLANWKMNERTGATVADVKSTYAITKPTDVFWYPLATGLVLSGNNISTPNGISQLTATGTPDPTVSVAWSVNDQSIAQISSTGLLSALKNGTVTVTATTNDGSNISSTKNIVVSGQSITGLSESTTGVKVFPVVFENQVTIKGAISVVELFNSTGVKVATQPASSVTIINTSNIAKGIYVLVVDKKQSYKLVK